jgi:hypothetical protein
MNVIAGLGVYGAILREAGEALHCPRRATCDSVGEACNSDLVARCIAWAGISEVPATRCSTLRMEMLIPWRAYGMRSLTV